ncbi:MAG: type II toxin-antitoxin system RelE/ParE family toxin [Devosia sp.]
MAFSIVWSQLARQQVRELVAYIADYDAIAATNLRRRLEEVVQPLAEHPYMFRPGRVPGTREIVAHANYLIIYRVLANEIDITSVVHARREYP